MKQPDTLLHKRDAQLLCGVEDGLVVLTARRCSHVFDARATSAEDVVDEGKLCMGISTQSPRKFPCNETKHDQTNKVVDKSDLQRHHSTQQPRSDGSTSPPSPHP